MDCIFCKIINNEIPSKTIYEDEIVKVILDINPNADGHMLIIPKNHIDDFTKLDDNTLLHINKIANKMKDLIYNKLDNIKGLVLLNNYGEFQEVKHYHLHILPNGFNTKTKEIDEIYNELIS